MSQRCIQVRGARHNCLQNIDVDIPHRALTVVTGLSGSGKSSLAFDTLYAEGQRRYVETFSPYTRQFLERMDKPDVDSVDGIPPAIAIEQRNAVRTSRSTVGTMTEINDYLKMIFARLAGIVTEDGREIRPWTGEAITADLLARHAGKDVLITFAPGFDKQPTLASALAALAQQGYVRVLLNHEMMRTDASVAKARKAPKDLLVIQDRMRLSTTNRARLSEAVEGAIRAGKGLVRVLEWAADTKPVEHRYATDWSDPVTGETFRPPAANLFSFNNPIGACPTCRGFGRTIDIDYERALPDRNLSIAEGVVKPWQSGVSAECQTDLLRHCKKRKIRIDVPFNKLSKQHQRFVIDGEKGKDGDGHWYGVRGFFDWLETKTYKMHVRVFLSRYRAYRKCPTCNGTRYQPQSLRFTLAAEGRRLNIADVSMLNLGEAHDFLAAVPIPEHDEASRQLRHEAVLRLRYLVDVGLAYLTLDRTTRTLSGGEVQRVNLTSCLGNALVNTLFVLDEPSIGLHPRDTAQLLGIIGRLRDRGNTLVVVEHDEEVMRHADHVIDLGPGRGEAGGNVVFAGPFAKLEKSRTSLTADYLSGRKSIPLPDTRRVPDDEHALHFQGASANNIENLDITIPLGRFVGITGVSGSGKSTLVHDIIYRHLRRAHNLADEEAEASDTGTLKALTGAEHVGEIARVDQSPLSRTPRSNPALYLGIYESIRRLFAATEDAISQGLTAGDFSFNAGNGRCTRCNGTGYEKIEMQFLADVFVTCPQCEGRRFQPHVLGVTYRGWNIDRLLHATATQARLFFSADLAQPAKEEAKRRAEIATGLQALEDVGLGYLRLGQPLNQLSGGEAQRIKLLGYLHGRGKGKKRDAEDTRPRLIILDEPTTGLHFEDIRLLLDVLQRLVEQGDSLLVIEHNMDVIKCADWVIDLGPEAGADGGHIVAQGTPEEVAATQASNTGRFLATKLGLARPTHAKLAAKKALPARRRRSAKADCIEIRGARHHNLRDLSLDIDLNRMTVVTGLSGSGKSTLAFDLLFAEGQRRYLDSLNSYARQFVEQLEKPQVDSITGIPPAVAIEQRLSRGGRKSTVATVTEIYQFLRLLFAKLGRPHDPETGEAAVQQTAEDVFKRIERQRKRDDFAVLAPLVRGRKGFHTDVAKWAEKKGFPFLRVDGKWIEPAKFKRLDRYREHTIEAVLGNIDAASKPAERRRLVDLALTLGRGTLYTIDPRGKESVFSTQLACPESGRSFDELEPRLFSYNSPHGWCPTCQGYGTTLKKRIDGDTEAERELNTALAQEALDLEDTVITCPSCNGARLNAEARSVRLDLGKRGGDLTITEIGAYSIEEALALFQATRFTGAAAVIARDILPEIVQRLHFLRDVGLGYLTLDRSAVTLSGGESQRIRLAAQIGSNLQGVLYVLDEPTIGLHPRDNQRLLHTLDGLKAKGNTLVVVEHDEDTMRAADDIIDLGPGAGRNGGRLVARGSWKKLSRSKESVTGKLLGEPLEHPLRGERRAVNRKTPKIRVRGSRVNNHQRLSLDLPQGRLIVLSGVSGAGKSTLMHDVLKPALAPRKGRPLKGPWTSVKPDEPYAAVYEVDQAPIGKTSRSTPATYIGLMDDLRALFAQLPLARQRGYAPGRFSFNSGQGRCEECQGQGALKVEMNFLPPTWIACDACDGRRYKPETLEVLYEGRSIADVLEMTIDEAADFFSAVPRLQRPLELLRDTGLGYLSLGQRSPTLSGGEAQRIKLVAELARSLGVNAGKRLKLSHLVNRKHLYLLEEPTIGLHLADVRRLLDVLHQLVDVGHSVVVIEHHLDVIAEADWVVELGPEGGENGGRLIVADTPEAVAKNKASVTAPYLQELFKTTK